MTSAIRNGWRAMVMVIVLGTYAQAQQRILPKVFSADEVEEIDLPAEILDVDDGLSQGYISSIAQDSLGFLWIATNDGLNRYDGYNFQVFRQDPLDSLSVSANATVLHMDKAGRLLVSGYRGRLDLYNPGPRLP
ncbi:MAG: two-component regulator propeller domain-containing protein [Bacteroidia bacterium]